MEIVCNAPGCSLPSGINIELKVNAERNLIIASTTPLLSQGGLCRKLFKTSRLNQKFSTSDLRKRTLFRAEPVRCLQGPIA